MKLLCQLFSNSYTVLHSTFYSKLLKNGHIICFDGIFQLEKCPSVQSTMYSCTVQYVVERIIGNIQYRLAYCIIHLKHQKDDQLKLM